MNYCIYENIFLFQLLYWGNLMNYYMYLFHCGNLIEVPQQQRSSSLRIPCLHGLCGVRNLGILHMSYSLNSLKGRLYRGLYMGVL